MIETFSTLSNTQTRKRSLISSDFCSARDFYSPLITRFIQALKSAKAGLDYCYTSFEFARSGTVLPFGTAMDTYTDRIFKVGHIKGTAPKAKSEVKVPYKGVELSGEKLVQQLERWCEYGTIEPTARDAIMACVRNPGW